MAICIIKSTAELGEHFILTPERYNPRRRMNLSQEDSGVLLSEIVTLENIIITAKKNELDWYQINTSDAIGGCLNVPHNHEKLNSNKKLIKKGDVIISRLRPYLHQVAYVDVCINNLCASTEFYVLRSRNDESIAFLVPFLLSFAVQKVFTNAVEGSQHPRFKEEDLLNLVIPLKLFLERKQISSNIEEAINKYRVYESEINSAIQHINRIIPIN